MKMPKGLWKKGIVLVIVGLFIGVIFIPTIGSNELKLNSSSDQNTENRKESSLSITLQSSPFEIIESNNEIEIEMKDFGQMLEPGKPKLPSKTFLIGVPPGGEVTSVEVVDRVTQLIPGSFKVVASPSFSNGFDTSNSSINMTLYSSETAYPSTTFEYLGMGQMRKYRFAKIRFNPISYIPKTGKLTLYNEITIKLNYKIVNEVSDELLADSAMDDIASENILNFDSIHSSYTMENNSKNDNERSKYDYVIITLDSLEDDVSFLKNWKESQGYFVNVVKKSWISSNYDGVDIQEKIRNFLMNKYVEWGITYVLIVGSNNSLPMRTCYPNKDDHTEKVITDYYYADLTGVWDSDDDGYFGERDDDNVDFCPEIWVGRIPFDNSIDVMNCFQNIASFEQSEDDWKTNALLLAAISNYENEDGNTWEKTDNAEVTEEIINDILTGNGYSATTMYEKDGLSPSTYSCDHPLTHSNVLSEWPNGYGLMVSKAHSNPSMLSRKIWSSDDNSNGHADSDEITWESFYECVDTNYMNHPSMIYENGCNIYNPDFWMGNLVESGLKEGACGIIATSSNGWYTVGWDDESDGGSGSMQYYFVNNYIQLLQGCGAALYNSKLHYITHYDWWGWSIYENMYGFNLFGDPTLMATGTHPDDQLSPEANLNLLRDIKQYADEITTWIDNNWVDATTLVNPFASNEEKQQTLENIAKDFPEINIDEHSINSFIGFMKNIIANDLIISYTDVNQGILVNINNMEQYRIEGDLPVDKIILQTSIVGSISTTFIQNGDSFIIEFTPYLDLKFIPPGLETGFEIRYTAHIGDIDVSVGGDMGLCFSTLPLNPTSPITPILHLDIFAKGFDTEVTFEINEPFSQRYSTINLGAKLVADISGYIKIGGGVELEGGVFGSIDTNDLTLSSLIQYCSDFSSCIQDNGGLKPTEDIILNHIRSLETLGCAVESLPDSTRVGAEFGITGKLGLGVGGEAIVIKDKVSIDGQGAASAALSCEVNKWGQPILDFEDKLSRFYIATCEQANAISEYISTLDFSMSTTDYDKSDYWQSIQDFLENLEIDEKEFINNCGREIIRTQPMLDSLWTAIETAKYLQPRIPTHIQRGLMVEGNLGAGVGGGAAVDVEIPALEVSGEMMAMLSVETTLETLLAAFALDANTLINNAYGGFGVSRSVSGEVSYKIFAGSLSLSKNMFHISVNRTVGDTRDNIPNNDARALGITNVIKDDEFGNDTDNDGLFNQLVVNISFDIGQADNYTIAGMLFENNTCVGFFSNTTFYQVGNHVKSLIFNGLNIRNQQLNGSYNISIYAGPKTIDATYLINHSLDNTRYYTYDEFQESSINDSDVSHQGFDQTKNSFYDYLQVELMLNSSLDDDAYVEGFLSNQNQYIENHTVVHLNQGINTVYLYFDGQKIHQSGLDAPYDFSYRVFNSKGVLIHRGMMNITGYNYSDFEVINASLSNSYQINAVDADADGFYDGLSIDIGVNVSNPGEYTVSAHLKGNRTYYSLQNTSFLSESSNMTLFVNGCLIRETKRNHTFSLQNLALKQNQSILGMRPQVNLSGIWNYTDFSLPIAWFIDNFSDTGLDTDGNGLYDYLQIDCTLNTSVNESLLVVGLLNASNTLIYAERSTEGITAEQNIKLHFEGESIYQTGYNGSMKLEQLGIVLNGKYISLLFDVFNTSMYNYTDFEHVAQPRANFSYNPLHPKKMDLISFTDLSTDADGDIVNWSWDFGDGNSSYLQNPTHQYSQSGNYLIYFNVTDNENYFDSTTKQINVTSEICVNISLKTGWNLITIPVNNNWLASTLAENITGCQMVSWFDAQNQTFRTHIAGVPGYDFSTKDGVGYFVYVDQNSTLSVSGQRIDNVSMPIYVEWNSIGWFHDYNTTASSLGENITNCSMVSWFDAEYQTFKTHIVGVPGYDFTIIQGMGLFVYVYEASIWYGEG